MVIEIKPITKILWFDPEVQKKWEPRIRRVAELYNETELATFIAGLRKLYIYHVSSDDFTKSYDFLRENDLIFFPTNKSAKYQGFSHKHIPVTGNEPFTLYGGVVRAEDKELGEQWKEMNNSIPVDHIGIGRLLGYPECCLEYFDKFWGKPSIDPMFRSALESPDAVMEEITLPSGKIVNKVTVRVHPFSNQMLRYFGIRITPQLNCSTQCEASIEWGAEWFKIMLELDEEAARWALELLSMPLTWDCYKGIAIIDTPLFRGVTNSDQEEERKIVENLGWPEGYTT